MTRRPIDEIKVGERFRKDLGDLSGLKESIEAVGLLHPVVVLSDGTLVAGARRVAACRELGWDEIPVTVAQDLETIAECLQAERDENTCRLDMKPTEYVALGKKMEEAERRKARERQAHGETGPGKNASENFTQASKGRTRDLVGAAVAGVSGVTYNRAKAVVEKAEAGDPVAIEAVAEMDRTGKVIPAYEKVVAQNGGYQIKTERHQQLAAAANRRMVKLIAGLDGYRIGLADFDVQRALAVSPPEQVDGWVETLTGTIRELGRLKKELLLGGTR